MFTGIVQTIGTIDSRRDSDAGVGFHILASDFGGALSPGDSVAINGVCHTVESCDADGFTVTAVGETLAVTTMSDVSAGDNVNLELAATLDTALGGHLVQGHVDGTGDVVDFEQVGSDRLLRVRVPDAVAAVVLPRGSITIDGVSLTAISVEGDVVKITIVPHTLENTIASGYLPGTRVNVEADMIGKYVQQYVARSNAKDGA